MAVSLISISFYIITFLHYNRYIYKCIKDIRVITIERTDQLKLADLTRDLIMHAFVVVLQNIF